MKLTHTEIPGMVLIEPQVFRDARGFFVETFQAERFAAAGLPDRFLQDNHSRSTRGTLRGLHYQIRHPQGKLLRVVRGAIYDVAVDLRRESPTFGRWASAILSEQNPQLLYVPPGCAHGFCALEEPTEILYQCTDLYFPEHERTLLWNDLELGIPWPERNPILSDKDRQGVPFAEAEYYETLCGMPLATAD